MISKKHRFHGHHALDFTYRRGRTVRGEFLGLRYIKSKENNYRLAVVVSKKVSKSAVVRNRIRRRIYEAVRVVHQKSPLLAVDMILSVYDEKIAAMPATELFENIHKLIRKTDTSAPKNN